VPGPGPYEPGDHPAASMPLAYRLTYPYCPAGHYKHQLFRLRRPGELVAGSGRHSLLAEGGRRVRESEESLLVHHVPFREREATRSRLLHGAATRYATGTQFSRDRVLRRLELLDDLYAGRYERITNEQPGERRRGLAVEDWRKLVHAGERE